MPFPTPHITHVALCHEVPLDATYRNSIYWASKAAQASYFVAKVKSGATFTDCSYHRETDRLRVNLPIQDCLDVNYCFWSNTAYDGKVYYAFVTGHHYVNANCTALEVQVDVLQTYYFDYDILPCFIERCHQTTDAIGDNVVAENLSIGEYEIAHTSAAGGDTYVWDIVAYTTFDWSTWQMAPGTLNTAGNMYSGLKRTIIGQYTTTRSGYTYNSNWSGPGDPGAKLQDLLQNHAELVDGLCALVIAPHYFEANYQDVLIINKPVAKQTPLGANYTTRYIPRNNKLYVAPFCEIMVSNGSGAEKTYAFEDFHDSPTASFRIYSDRAPDQSLILVPEGYRGTNPTPAQTDSLNFADALTLTGFPQLAWVSDSFKTYLAQNKSNIALTAALGVGKVVAGVAALGAAGVGEAASAGAASPLALPLGAGGVSMITSGVSDVGRLLVDLNDASKQPPRPHGQTTGSALMAVNEKRFRAYVLTPKAEYARIIDNYFDLYGYAQMKIGSINIAARPHWTYTKTRGAVAVPHSGSGCSAAALAAIQYIFDRGITFWRVASEVGDYSLDNSV